MGRFVGIRHRVKRTAEVETQPTLVAIIDGDREHAFELADEMAELDFVLGRYPTAWRDIRANERREELPAHHVRNVKKRGSDEETLRVPAALDGLTPGDTVAMVLGGTGDRLAFALSRRAQEIGAAVLRIPPFVLKEKRGDSSKEEDHVVLARLAQASQELFYPTGPRDRDLIRVREAYRARRDAQRERIRCEQRLHQRVIGRIFLSPEGKYPEGEIEDTYDAEKASDVILTSLVKEEAGRTAELKAAVHALDIWKEVFKPIEGCGETIAAGIIASVGDVRRFATDSKMKAYLGVHVLPDGRFPRKRLGSIANWAGQGRQALYQIGEQFVYRADSVWGLKLREAKRRLREKHPEATIVNGKKRYADGHIHKMAIWRTITRFTEHLHREWTRIEAAHRA